MYAFRLYSVIKVSVCRKNFFGKNITQTKMIAKQKNKQKRLQNKKANENGCKIKKQTKTVAKIK